MMTAIRLAGREETQFNVVASVFLMARGVHTIYSYLVVLEIRDDNDRSRRTSEFRRRDR